MRTLVIDVGNSRCKLAVGDSQGFPIDSYQVFFHSDIKEKLGEIEGVDACVVSSVHEGVSREIQNYCSNSDSIGRLFFMSASLSTIPLAVTNPDSLGADRIAAAIGATTRSPKTTIIVDSGTATTIDLINHGVFRGGVIYPGMDLALDSLAKKTDKLPQVHIKPNENPIVPGTDTEAAIRAGVFWSQVGGVERIVSDLLKEFGNASVLVTGGNGERILNSSSIDGQYVPTLVLEGLWTVGSRLEF